MSDLKNMEGNLYPREGACFQTSSTRIIVMVQANDAAPCLDCAFSIKLGDMKIY